jgi:hypothetical protein
LRNGQTAGAKNEATPMVSKEKKQARVDDRHETSEHSKTNLKPSTTERFLISQKRGMKIAIQWNGMIKLFWRCRQSTHVDNSGAFLFM